MSHHLTTQQITHLLARQLAPSELEAVLTHFATCATCRQRINEAGHTTERVAYLRTVLTLHETEPASPQPPRKWRRLIDAVGQYRLWHPVPLTATICALLLVSSGLIWWRNAHSSLIRDIASATPTPVLSPAPAAIVPPPAILIALNDKGQQIRLDETGRLTGLPALPPAQEQAVRLALTKQRLTLPAELISRQPAVGTLRGKAEDRTSLTLLSPVGTFVREVQPRLCWRPVRGALSYSVQVLDDEFNLVAAGASVTATCWQPPQKLIRNRQYLWQVTARLDGAAVNSTSATLPEARFKVLSAQQARQVQRAARNYASSHLALGTLYAQAGLLDDAEREFRQLLKANPQSATAKKLLAQLQRR